jgi:hypothetical protein
MVLLCSVSAVNLSFGWIALTSARMVFIRICTVRVKNQEDVIYISEIIHNLMFSCQKWGVSMFYVL